MFLDVALLSYRSSIQIRETKLEGKQIFDPVRNDWYVFQPEEWVRQLMIQYLLIEKKYPLRWLRSEYGIRVRDLMRRCDIVVFDKQILPRLIVECKAFEVALTEQTILQIAQYNETLQVPFLVITNGLQTACARIVDENNYHWLTEIPDFEHLIA